MQPSSGIASHVELAACADDGRGRHDSGDSTDERFIWLPQLGGASGGRGDGGIAGRGALLSLTWRTLFKWHPLVPTVSRSVITAARD